jgi:hypothetical protein
MKKAVLALTTIISVILSISAVEFQAALLARGNFVPLSTVTITFPENDKNYFSSTLTVRYSAHFTSVMRKLVYNLDGKGNVTIYDDNLGPADFNGSVTLTGLAAGSHHIEIYSESGTWFAGGDKVYFNIFISPSLQHISIQSPQNGTNHSEPVLLNFTAKYSHFPEGYSYIYTIDGQSIESALESHQWVEPDPMVGTETVTDDDFKYVEYTIRGSVYLPNLGEGEHKLTLYSRALYHSVNDYDDVETVYFNTGEPVPTSTPTPSPEPKSTLEPFPITLVAASGTSAALIGIGLLVYFKKRKH